MPRRRRRSKRRVPRLDFMQEDELIRGPAWPREAGTDRIVAKVEPRSVFDSDAARREAWEVHRNRLLEREDRRPWAALHYDDGLGPVEAADSYGRARR